MADTHESLGKASLDLTADLVTFEKNVKSGQRTAEGMGSTLEHVAAIADIAERALKQVKMSPGQGAESKASAEGILSGVRGISEEARQAARELDHVRLTEAQAAASDAAGDIIDRKLKSINRNANETRRALDRVKIAGGVPGRSGVGVGPFGSGFGRVGLLGAAVGAGALLASAAGPGTAGLLAAIPGLAFGAAGAVGTLALAFGGVGAALKGDKKAFDDLGPSAQKFVLSIRSLDGWFDTLKQTAAGSLFPGLTTGLKAALSPGTTGALTTGVQQFGAAIGQAATQWGKYFGSPKFQQLLGPLMQAGAKNFKTLSSAVLHLFDAFAVLGRAAIPFTSWFTKAIDNGSRFASSWLRAKEATGGLGRAMNEAKSSLRLVGGLFVSLLRVVGALGRALYPVSKLAIKALTDGLNALAKIITRNQNGIREFVAGALKALVSIVKIAAPIVAKLAHGLSSVVHAIGGWKTAFEIVISGFLAAKFIALAGAISKVRVGLLGLGSAWEVLGPIGMAVAGFGGVAVAGFGALAYASRDHNAPAGFHYVPTGPRTPPKLVRDSVAGPPGGADRSNHPGIQGPGRNVPHAGSPPKPHVPSPFGTPPPFTKNLGAAGAKPPVIPAGAAHLEQLASADASRASVLGNVGVAAKKYLESELGELSGAAKLIRAKYETATGSARTQLFAALTGVENKMRTVRERIGKAIRDDRAAELQFAVDQAKNAVASATEGSAAYEKAISAEEKALRAQIAYLDKRAKNSHLSLKEREKAIRGETADKKALASLLKKSAVNAGANEAQFLSSFADIVKAFAPNAFPAQPAAGGGRTDTHLYDIKTELRQQTPLLRDAVQAAAFPGSAMSGSAALAVAG